MLINSKKSALKIKGGIAKAMTPLYCTYEMVNSMEWNVVLIKANSGIVCNDEYTTFFNKKHT